MERYRWDLIGKVDVTSNYRRIQTNSLSDATFQLVGQSLSYFYWKGIAQSDGVNSEPLDLYYIHSNFNFNCLVFVQRYTIQKTFLSFLQSFYLAWSHISICTHRTEWLTAHALFQFMVVDSFQGCSFFLYSFHNWFIVLGNNCYTFLAFIFFASLQWSCHNM